MTRTARATNYRALNKDRSVSRSGMDKSLKKDGAGRANWGSLKDLGEDYENGEFDDEVEAENANAGENASVSETGSEVSASSSEPKHSIKEDIEAARALRKRGMSGTVDLGSIARTSVAVSTSPEV